MKTDQTLSIIFRQPRPFLRQPHSVSRALSQIAPLRHPTPPYTRKRSIPILPFPSHSLQTRRVSDSTSAPSSAVAQSPDYPSNIQSPPAKAPAYELTFTCKPCQHRSTHNISKQGYHKGSVLITCPGCSNRHIMSDHLKVGFQSLCLLHAKLKNLEAMDAENQNNRYLETDQLPSKI